MNWLKQNINQIMVTASGAFLGFLMAGAFTIFTIFGWALVTDFINGWGCWQLKNDFLQIKQ